MKSVKFNAFYIIDGFIRDWVKAISLTWV